MGFQLTKSTDPKEWDALVASSQQGSIFSDSRYLQALSQQHTCYFVKTTYGEILAGVAVMEDNRVMHSAPFPFAPYQGIMFGKVINIQPTHKRVTSEFRITEFLIESLIDQYGNFNMALPPSFTDMRPFQWHNYHDPFAPRFNIRLRNTAILDFSVVDSESYLMNIRSVRRQESKKSSAEILDSMDVEEFVDIYMKTFQRQDIEIDEGSLSMVRRICVSALGNCYGRLSKAVVNGSTASMSLFVFDNNCGYYLFGANDPDFRNSGASSKLMINNILNLSAKGLNKIDFVGVNSPNRGDYKLSFGPTLEHYFEVELREYK